jgi:hypothetical protein
MYHRQSQAIVCFAASGAPGCLTGLRSGTPRLRLRVPGQFRDKHWLENARSVSGSGRRPFLIIVATFAAGLLGYELWPRDETRIASLLNGLCAKLNETRDERSLTALRQALRSTLLPTASVRIRELDSELEGAPAVAERAGELLDNVPLSFSLSSIEAHVSGRLARVDADVSIVASGSDEQRRDLRHTSIRLSKTGEQWRIESLELDAVAPSQPEARP